MDGRARSQAAAVVVAWEGGRIGASYADRAAAQGLAALTGITAAVHDGRGRLLDEQAWIVPPAPKSPAAPPAERGAAPVVTITTREDPAQFVRNMFTRLSPLFGRAQSRAGRVIRVVDPHGSLILVTAHSPRLRASETWVRPGLAGDYPYAAVVLPNASRR